MGTSLFDPAQLGPNDIAKLLETLRSQGGPNALGLAHLLPAMRSVASAPTAHMLPPMVSSAPAPGSAQMLPAMHSGGAASTQVQTPSAISALLQTLIGGPSMTPSAGAPPNAMGGPGPSVAQLPGGPSPMQQGMQAGGPSPAPPINIGGQSMPGQQAMPLPAPQSPEQPHMLQRVVGLLSSLGGGIKHLGEPADAKGYDGLLSSDEIQSAKPGFMARLSSITPGAPTPGEQYHENLDNIVKMRGIAAGVAETARQRSAIREMADRFPQPQPTGDPVKDRENMQQYLLNNYGFAMSHGLSDIGKEYGSSLRGIMAVPKPDTLHVIPAGGLGVDKDGHILAQAPTAPRAPLPGSDEWKAAEEYKAALAAKYRVEPTQIIQGQDDQGGSHFYVVPKRGGAPVPIAGVAPKVTVKSESAQQELTRARAEAAVSEMNNGSQYMHDFEQKLATGQVKIGNAGQIISSIANTFTHDDPASKAIQNTALTVLNKSNPDLARYIRRALSFAEGESMISTRPSDFRTRMSAFLSAAANGATPDMISDIESRRNSILTPLNRIYAQPTTAPTRAARPSPAPSGAAQSYEDWKRSKGIP